MLPVWLVQVFGQSKSFVANPIIGNRLLNRLGLHVIRMVGAHAARRVRLLYIAPFVDKQAKTEFWRNGFIKVEDFLAPEQLEALKREVSGKGGNFEVRQCIQGDTLTQRVLLDEQARGGLPAVDALLKHPRYKILLAFVGATYKQPLFYIQKIANGYAGGDVDPQKTLHSDTFHPTMKAWFFLDDVPAEKGPFTYAPGSHRLTWKRIKWEYYRSIHADELESVYSRRGSMRADDDDLKAMGYQPRAGLAVRKNTLVVADTHGFHCRGQAEQGASRLEIWAYCRTNPFSLIAGTGSRLTSRLENKAARAFWKYEDARAAKRGNKSSWHIVDSSKMFTD